MSDSADEPAPEDTRGAGLATLDLLPRPSVKALKLLLVMHMLPVASVPLLALQGWPVVVVVGAIAASWFYVRRHPALGFGPRAITRIVWNAEDGWQAMVGGKTHKAELLGNTFVSGWLIVLRLKLDDGRHCSRVFAGGEVGDDLLRRLRAQLLQARGNPPDANA